MILQHVCRGGCKVFCVGCLCVCVWVWVWAWVWVWVWVCVCVSVAILAQAIFAYEPARVPVIMAA